MGEGDLDAELRRRAKEASDALMRTAKADADRIAAEAEKEIETRERDALRGLERTLRLEARAHIAAARHDAMRAVLFTRQRVVDRVLARAEALLPEVLERDAFNLLLEEQLLSALDFIGERGAVVRCAPRIASMLQTLLANKPGVVLVIDGDVGSGFVAASGEGSVKVDATLENRLRRLAPSLAIEIQRRLEGR